MIRATLGFIFSDDLNQVLLIKKNRPAWQAGKINGVGGKCEGKETYAACISREVAEETGLDIPPFKWKDVAQLEWENWKVKVLATVLPKLTPKVSSLTDEEVSWVKVKALPTNCMSNLFWLIPLAIDVLDTQKPPKVSVKYP